MNNGLANSITGSITSPYLWFHILFHFHFRYEGCALNLPSTNNGCESFNAKIKRQCTLRNRLPLSSFLPKIELMLADWSKYCESNPFATCTPTKSSIEIAAYKWITEIGRTSIHHWYDNFYVVPSSNAQM